jgi:hypothetical protein
VISIEVGSVTTGDPGTDVEITNVGTDTEVILDFVIPRGADGAPGNDGADGEDGADSALLTIDRPPVSPNAKDDEFDSVDTLPGGASAKWAWRNQGAATATVQDGALVLTAPIGGAVNCRCLFQSAPAAPWAVVAKVTASALTRNSNKIGIALGDGTRVETFGFSTDSVFGLRTLRFSSPTSFSSVLLAMQQCSQHEMYFRVKDTGVNLEYAVSVTGHGEWVTLVTAARTSFFPTGVTEIGLMAASEDAQYPASLVCHWFRVTT